MTLCPAQQYQSLTGQRQSRSLQKLRIPALQKLKQRLPLTEQLVKMAMQSPTHRPMQWHPQALS